MMYIDDDGACMSTSICLHKTMSNHRQKKYIIIMMIIIIKGCDSTFMSCNFQKLGWNEYILCSYMKLKDLGVIERVVNKETEKYDSMTFTWPVFNIHMFFK